MEYMKKWMKFTLNQIIREKKYDLKELQLNVKSKIFQQHNKVILSHKNTKTL